MSKMPRFRRRPDGIRNDGMPRQRKDVLARQALRPAAGGNDGKNVRLTRHLYTCAVPTMR